jgi:CAAX protease family protein
LASTGGIFFIGIFFGLGYLGTGNLAMPMGQHMAWNLFQGTVYGLAVSGDKEPASFFLTRQMGPDLAAGGGFGPEAGLIGMLAAVQKLAPLR